jgi:hypothetical protein
MWFISMLGSSRLTESLLGSSRFGEATKYDYVMKVLGERYLCAVGCETHRADPSPAVAVSAAPLVASTAPPKPIVISGIAIQPTADFGVGAQHVWALTFNQVESPEEAAQWAKGVRGFNFTAAALPDQPEATWKKVGPGDRVTFECAGKKGTEPSGCKLTGFQDTTYSLKPVIAM